MHTPYVFPQENGGRADVRWLELRPPPLPTATRGQRRSLAFVAGGSGGTGAPNTTDDDPDGDGNLSGAPHSLALASVSRHSALELHAARHQHELPGFGGGGGGGGVGGEGGKSNATPTTTRVVHVHLDAVHMGVGGDDSWSPTVHAGYLLPPGRYRFAVAIVVAAAEAGAGLEGEVEQRQQRRLASLHRALARRWLESEER
jgi:beta-galactosidase